MVHSASRLLRPERIDQLVARDDPVGAKQQQGQERALFAPAEPHRAAIRADFERAEDAEIHASTEGESPTQRALYASGDTDETATRQPPGMVPATRTKGLR